MTAHLGCLQLSVSVTEYNCSSSAQKCPNLVAGSTKGNVMLLLCWTCYPKETLKVVFLFEVECQLDFSSLAVSVLVLWCLK